MWLLTFVSGQSGAGQGEGQTVHRLLGHFPSSRLQSLWKPALGSEHGSHKPDFLEQVNNLIISLNFPVCDLRWLFHDSLGLKASGRIKAKTKPQRQSQGGLHREAVSKTKWRLACGLVSGAFSY